MTSSPHGSYVWGNTHATMADAERRDLATGSKSQMSVSVQIGGCNSPP
jgi:hypothetical protein